MTTTGLDDVDFWIGGLAEQIMPFGGMLGSTFNFVFETQLEKLQNGDRFYYLERTSNLNFLTELENNSFAKVIMANTDATHLPGLVFLTPAFTLEVDQTRQFNPSVIPGPDGILLDDPLTPINEAADNLPGNADPVGGSALTPLVIRDNPATLGPDTNYLHYTGAETVIVGGTLGNDILIAGASDDDTVYGDAGNDQLEGGFGNDTLRGGVGDDIITDIGGDDVIHGEDGNDVIHGGNGINLILAGFGSDFVVTGVDASEAFGGPGNDFILGADTNEQDMGNEGDDWLQGGLLDGSPGDNFDGFGLDLIIGNDVFLGSGGPDIMIGEGGDDIMVGSSGPADKYLGASGFDWATFKDEPSGVTMDLNIIALDAGPIPAAAGILARFAQVEGLSGSRFSDILYGDNADALTIPTAGLQGSVLTNIGLIAGLQDFLGAGVTSFGSGNIILGGDGSDLIEGRGGNDLIDGDKWLNVRISVRANPDGTGAEIASFDNMVPLVPLMLDGTYNPGQLVIVREIMPGNGGFDTAVYAGPRLNYTVLEDDNGTPLDPTDDVITVIDNVGIEGTDRLTNIERLQFADQSIVLVPGLNAEPEGLLTISDFTPAIGDVLSVSAPFVSDADGLGPISFIWQVETAPGTGIFQDIQAPTGVGVVRAIGPSFTVTADLAGRALRVQGVYQDLHGVLETVASAPTDPVTSAAPTVAQPIADRTVLEDAAPVGINLAAVFTDPDVPFGDVLTFSAVSADPALVATSVAGNQLTLIFQPNANGGPTTVSVTATDLSGISVTDIFNVTVTAVNDAPTFTNGANVIALEDSGPRTVLGWATAISAGPANEAGQTLAFLVTADNPALFSAGPAISPTGTLTFTPAPNANGATTVTVQLQDNGGTANGGVNLSATQTFAINVTAVNDAPSFTKGADVTALEDSGPRTVSGWATAMSAGPPDEAGQTLAFLVTAGNPALFSAGPAISPTGTLTFTPAPNANGATTVTVQLQDNGGTANGGVNLSAQTFVITVTAVNDQPTFTAANPPSVDQGAGPQSIPGWVTSVTFGPANEASQAVLGYVVSAVSNPALFAAGPTVAANGTLSYAPAPGARGTATFAVAVRDNGGTANGGVDTSVAQTFTILVNPVVQLPGGGGSNAAVVSRVGANLRVVNNVNQVLFNAPLGSFTKLTVLGAANKTDTVTVDPAAGGGFALAQGVTFDGGAGTGIDTLIVRGTAGVDVLTVRSQIVPTPSNLVVFQNAATALDVRFTGTERVRLEGQGGNDTYGIDALPVNVTVADSGGTDTLDFSRAAGSVTVNLGGAVPQAVFGGTTSLTLPPAAIENVIGTALNDTITGDSRANRIFGGDGNDLLNGGAGNDLVFGGLGNDTFQGGAGNNVLVGGDGNDILRSGPGRNVMIGGLGADDLRGNSDSDLLIGGRTTFDQSEGDLLAILAEWSAQRSIDLRVANLTRGLGPTRTPFLRPGESVLNDNATDVLFGGLGADWFLSFANDNVLDRGVADRPVA